MSRKQRALTSRQVVVLEILANHIREHGFAPTMRELGEFLNISETGAQRHVEALHKKGYVDRQPEKARALSLAEKAMIVVGARKVVANG